MKRKFFTAILVFFIPFILYLISALILGLIQHEQTAQTSGTHYQIYVVSSDIHTEFLLPVKNELFDFTKVLPIERVFSDPKKIQFISIGWGSRDFFFQMKTWDDIRPGVILRSVFLPSESAIHVEYLEALPEHQLMFPLIMDESSYKNLVHFILNSFKYDQQNKVQQLGEFSYYGNDRFYKGQRPYHMFNTCNMWTNEGLKVIGQRRPLWSPFKYAIEYALRSSGEK